MIIWQAAEKLNEIDAKIFAECPFLGKRVVIIGVSREDIDGHAGVASIFEHDRGWYLVTLDGEAKELVKVKPQNLREEFKVLEINDLCVVS